MKQKSGGERLRLFRLGSGVFKGGLKSAFIGPALYALTALGLYYRIPLAGFLAWFIFIGPGLAEFTHFIFPLLTPAIEPNSVADVSQVVAGKAYISNMPNYFIGATGRYYFSGLYTAVLPMIPGVFAIYRVMKASRDAQFFSLQQKSNSLP